MSDISWGKFGKLTVLDGVLLVVLAIGLFVAGISLFRGITMGDQVQVEFLDAQSKALEGDRAGPKLIVDVAGAVISPGVYALIGGSRIRDALIAAGGFAANADRTFCEKNINLAQELKDGQKIYIPFVSDTPTDGGYAEAKLARKMVNVNTASQQELDTLWGVGPARAETIVKNRPYASLEEVVSKGGMTKQIFENNRERISVY